MESDHTESEAAEVMREALKRLELIFPQFGIALLVFEFDEPVSGRMNWASNARREDMVCALKEMAAQLEGRVHEAPATTQ